MKPIDLAIYDDSDELETETDLRNPDHIIPSYWLFFTRENGNLYVYTVPGFQLVYMVKKVNQLHEVLYDDLDSANEEDRYMNVSTIAIAPQASESKGSESVMIKPEEVRLN
jgi:hypothetical protein